VTLNVAPVVLVILSSTALRELSAPPVLAVVAVVPAGAAVVGELTEPVLQAARMAPAASAATAVQAARCAGGTRFVPVPIVILRIISAFRVTEHWARNESSHQALRPGNWVHRYGRGAT
jgi:hypothetical protein